MPATVRSRLFCLSFYVYRAAILPVVLYGCETWLLSSWEETKRQEARGGGLHGDEIICTPQPTLYG